MTGAASRRRGASAENVVAKYLRTVGWPDARRYLAGDGRQPGDIDFEPGICLEVKDRAKSAWPSWRAQTVAEAGHRVPIVLRRSRGITDVGQWTAQVPTVRWMELGGRAPHDLRADVVFCDRTEMWWVRLPFELVVDVLRGEQEAAA